MKLLNDFYSIVDETSSDVTYNCKVKMNPQHETLLHQVSVLYRWQRRFLNGNTTRSSS